MKERVFNIYKPILFISLGTLILIFNDVCYSYLNVTIGVVMALFGLFHLLTVALHEGFIKHISRLFYGIVLMIIAIVLIATFNENLYGVAIVWSIWSILREGKELGELFNEYKYTPVKIISGLESVVVIVLAVMLMINPTEHHIIFHIYILGIELLLEIIFPFLDKLFSEKANNNKKESNNKHNK